MKFSVLALDYDGTIANNGVLTPDVRAAIMEARARGIVVLLVTGRILSELKQAAGELDFADAVVAENGAVIAFPNGQSKFIGRCPPQLFVDELRRRGIEFKTGQCVVEAEATSALQILPLIRERELPLVIVFNRSRLMVLPPAISKSTGLREALKALRLSAHNAIAIGDAENDHDLLAECEIAVAVSWGSTQLQKEANEVVLGDGPSAVAAYIRQVSKETKLPFDRIGRHRITLGTAENGAPVSIAIHGRNNLVVGEPKSGKSWATGLACEQMILQGYCVCVVDPEGDYGGLEALPGVVVLGNEGLPTNLPDVARALRHFDLSVVIDLSRAPYEEKDSYLKALLPMLASLRRATGLPHRIVVDEAHYFLHEPNVDQLLDTELGAYTLVTYRPSDLHPDLRKGIDMVLAKRLTDAQEIQTLRTMVADRSAGAEWPGILGELATNEAAFLPVGKGEDKKLRRFKLLPRLTPQVRHRTKYFDIQLLAGQEFVFTENEKAIGPPAGSLKQFVSLLDSRPLTSLEEHARRGDFSRWIANIFHDNHLASDVRKIEQRYRLGHLNDVRQPIAKLIRERYGISH